MRIKALRRTAVRERTRIHTQMWVQIGERTHRHAHNNYITLHPPNKKMKQYGAKCAFP